MLQWFLALLSAEVQDQTTASSTEKNEKSKSDACFIPASENPIPVQQDTIVVPALFKVRNFRSHHLDVDVANAHSSAS